MKPTGRANKPEQNLSNAIGGALTVSGLDLETKIFSASGRGRTFFLTSLFIELIDRSPGIRVGIPTGVVSVIAYFHQPSNNQY
jgi:hypothetical protein